MIKSHNVIILFTVVFAFVFPSSRARSIVSEPQPLPSFKLNVTAQNQKNARSCTYTVNIKTSCHSPRYTRDQISLVFGDAYGNQVYAPRLDDPSSRTFESCSEDRFDVYGPCTYQVCYLYLYRTGYDGWLPYSVEVYGYNTRAATFVYNVYIPANVWYGFNFCNGGTTTTTTSSAMK